MICRFNEIHWSKIESMSETTRIEYKQELTDGLEKEVIVFLNYHPEGGNIYPSIDKTMKTVGLSDLDGDALKVKDRLKHNIAPFCLGLFDICQLGTYSSSDLYESNKAIMKLVSDGWRKIAGDDKEVVG